MAVEDNTILMLGVVILTYLLLISPKSWTKNVLGGLVLVFTGLAAYMYLTTSQFWGILISIIGIIYLIFKITEL